MPRLRARAWAILIITGIVAAALWGIGLGLPQIPDEYTVAIIGAAMTFTVTGAVAIMILALWDRDKDLLIRALVDASQLAATAETAPLRKLRAVD